jgi:hypothetical protein
MAGLKKVDCGALFDACLLYHLQTPGCAQARSVSGIVEEV